MSFTPGAGTRFLVSTGASGTTPLSGPLSITGGTATANAPVLNATQTWNNAAVTFTGWQLNVTDTASNASSLLMDLQRGGVSQFRVRKDGQLAFNGDLVINPNDINLRATAANGVLINSTGVSIGEQSAIFFRDVPSGTIYSALRTAVSGVIEQRNGVNAQTLRVYNTFTDASNYERGIFSWVSNVLFIGNEGAGTGTTRGTTVTGSIFNVRISGVDRWVFDASSLRPFVGNSYDIGGTADTVKNLFQAGYHQMVEMTAPAAPATNSVRIYAEDNGSGKTRLMALFATGAAQQIAIEP